ncbi:hypothetical protein GCM10010201_27730 [Pilimelia columellifera subsp. columellifera]|uniref:histidine kinase n=2 Tax=Pilimelia TaxID=53370 RepID=A0ABP6B027_9ACTN
MTYDIALAVVLALVDAAICVGVFRLDRPWHWVVLVAQGAINLTIAFRRCWPQTVAAVLAASGLLMLLLPLLAPDNLFPAGLESVWVALPLSAAPAAYSVVAYGSGHGPWWLLALLTVVATQPWQPTVTIAAVGLNITLIPGLLGRHTRDRLRLLRAYADRAQRAEREQHLLAARARADERTRLARELHDVVAHRVSLMVLQAGAMRVSTADPAVADAAERLRRTGCEALVELRDLLGVLHGAAAPEPDLSRHSLADLPQLVEESRTVGAAVRCHTAGDLAVYTPVVSRTAYRVVQEGLTNAHKHAPGAPVDIRVDGYPDRLEVHVHSGAPTDRRDARLRAAGGGLGLRGLRHRVELVSGALTAGATADGGFLLAATLPPAVPTGATT